MAKSSSKKAEPAYKMFPDNPRIITDDELLRLGESMVEYGSLDGFVVNKSPGNYFNVIISGNQKSKHVDLSRAEIRIVEQHEEPTAAGTVAVGFAVYKGETFPYREVYWSDLKCQIANLRANNYGGHNDPTLMRLFPDSVLEAAGIDMQYEQKQFDLRDAFFNLSSGADAAQDEGDGEGEQTPAGGAAKASDDEYSVWETVLLHSQKLHLVDTLNRVRAENSLPNLAAALMHIVEAYDAQHP